MKFFSPWAFSFLSFIPLIVLMYLLKQKYEERIVSSTYLWELSCKDIEVNTPWQKLKKNILLILQLLSVLLFTLALSNPMISLSGKGYQSIIILIDSSGSMNTSYKMKSRLVEAKERAEGIVKGSPSGSKFTIISAGAIPEVLISATNSKEEAIHALKGITSSNSKASMEEAISLSKALSKQYEDYIVMIYSDQKVEIKDMHYQLDVIATKSQNASIEALSHSKSGEGIHALVRISNKNDVNISREISIFGEGNLISIQNVDLKPMETKNILIHDIPKNISSIYAELTEKDELIEDNIAFEIVEKQEIKKVLLVGTKNIFIEKMLSLIPGIVLYKTIEGQKIDDGYDLYIFDGNLPKTLPISGSLMIINPPALNAQFPAKEAQLGGSLKAEAHSLTKYIDGLDSYVGKMKEIEAPYWAEKVLSVNEKAAVVAGEYNGQRIIEIAFDLHDSDFVLSPQYPLFFNNMLSFLVRTGGGEITSIKAGEGIPLNISSDSKEAFVTSPSGVKKNIPLQYPISDYEDTDELGIYTVTQVIGEKEEVSLFCVNFPTETESDISGEEMTVRYGSEDGKKIAGGTSLLLPFTLLGFLVMLIEWVVFTRGV